MLIALGVLIALLASGCGREAAPVRPLAARVTELMAVNTADAYVDTIALSRDGSRVAIGQRNGSIRVWTPADGTEPATFGVSRQAVLDLAFGPPETCSPPSAVGEPGTRDGRPGAGSGPWSQMASVLVGQRCHALRFDGLGQRLGVMCEREVLIVDVAGSTAMGRVTSSHRDELTAFDLSANGARVVTAGHEGDVIVWMRRRRRRFRVLGGRLASPLPSAAGLAGAGSMGGGRALSPDGARAAAVTIEGTVYAWTSRPARSR